MMRRKFIQALRSSILYAASIYAEPSLLLLFFDSPSLLLLKNCEATGIDLMNGFSTDNTDIPLTFAIQSLNHD